MNPHFIFNVLNGLQSILILKSEEEVNRYMGHLSNLLRMTLDLSKKESINLGEEIGYLKSYIELQHIRLNNRLDYCIDISIDIETSNIYIPPLLIQPIVENAILHGIVPSKNKGILVISVKKNQNGLRFVVEDNGIGLERSKNQSPMQRDFTETLLVILFPLILSTAKVKDTIVIIAGIVSIIWVTIQIIDKLRKWNK